MRIGFIHMIDTNTPVVLEQCVSEFSVEEKSAAKKVANKLKNPKFLFICKNNIFLSTGRWQSDHINIIANTLKFNFHIFLIKMTHMGRTVFSQPWKLEFFYFKNPCLLSIIERKIISLQEIPPWIVNLLVQFKHPKLN